ncbi:NAD(P)-binding protein [Vibrio kyushuensis]|uniref:protoporphyrinogen/coproporphyrinogen oxidase n=1 Tax=Vibrio kyushuensis TaxID=2910249 RepID=UPI003D12CEF4
MKNKLVILGAGAAGLGAYNRAQELNLDVNVFEANSTPGGLLDNFSINGFRFDNAVHLSFTKNEVVRSLFDMTEAYKHEPDCFCIENGTWLKHPIQNNLYPLSSEDKVSIISSMFCRKEAPIENYSDWLRAQYGDVFSSRYPEKYTVKYWGLAAKELSTTWVGERMRKLDIDEILRGAFTENRENHYYTKEMRYPKKGGFFSFLSKVPNLDRINYNKKVMEIDTRDKVVKFVDGTSYSYDKLVSSLPLPVIIGMLSNVPEKVSLACDRLLWTTVDLISVGFNRENIPKSLWYYIYDEDILSSRAYSPSVKSPDNVPKGKSSMQFEIYNLSTESRLDKSELISNVKTHLLTDGICKEDDILFMKHKHLNYGNVVFYNGMESDRNIVLNFLNETCIKSVGRFGEWEYFWSDQSYLSGYKAI